MFILPKNSIKIFDQIALIYLYVKIVLKEYKDTMIILTVFYPIRIYHMQKK